MSMVRLFVAMIPRGSLNIDGRERAPADGPLLPRSLDYARSIMCLPSREKFFRLSLPRYRFPFVWRTRGNTVRYSIIKVHRTAWNYKNPKREKEDRKGFSAETAKELIPDGIISGRYQKDYYMYIRRSFDRERQKKLLFRILQPVYLIVGLKFSDCDNCDGNDSLI